MLIAVCRAGLFFAIHDLPAVLFQQRGRLYVQIATQYLLGIRPTPTGLLIDPCIPADWTGYNVTRRFRGCRLDISVQNPNDAQKGITSLTVEGKPVELSNGPLLPASIFAGKATASVVGLM